MLSAKVYQPYLSKVISYVPNNRKSPDRHDALTTSARIWKCIDFLPYTIYNMHSQHKAHANETNKFARIILYLKC